jgi:capsular exopolysaccharide synthesis family protein
MSEIFSWLKQAGLKNEKKYPEAVVPRGPGANSSTVDTIAPAIEQYLTDSAHEKRAIRSEAKFDLAAADRRIRNVIEPLTLAGEQYRLLRAKLSLMQRQRGIKSLLVTSSVPVEGKTFTACCLAGVFAQEPGKRVLLIDADMRKPRAEQTLGVDVPIAPVGLSQVLRGEKHAEDVLLSSSDSGLFLLPAGPVPDDPAELLSSPILELTIKNLSQIFDWVVIDSPPVISLADATLIAPLCDAALLIVRAGKTPSKLVLEAAQRIGKERICGVVLNRCRQSRATYYYYGYYRKDGTQKKG